MKAVPVARERRHTLFFLDETRVFAPVFLDTEVDMSAVLAHRAARRSDGERLSVVSYVLHAAGRTLAEHPEANAAIRGRFRARVARYPFVNGKLTLDRRLNGRRVVLATVLTGLESASLREIQDHVDHFRDGDADTMPEFAKVRALHKLPWLLGSLVFAMTARPLRTRAAVWGTFAVTSLGHRPVDGFHSVGGTTVTLGVGRIVDRPVVRDGSVVIAPVMRLSLAFDHRVIDGAEAADVLGDLKARLESAPEGAPVPSAAAPAERSR